MRRITEAAAYGWDAGFPISGWPLGLVRDAAAESDLVLARLLAEYSSNGSTGKVSSLDMDLDVIPETPPDENLEGEGLKK